MTATFAEDLKIKNLYPIKLLLFLQAAGKPRFLFLEQFTSILLLILTEKLSEGALTLEKLNLELTIFFGSTK